MHKLSLADGFEQAEAGASTRQRKTATLAAFQLLRLYAVPAKARFLPRRSYYRSRRERSGAFFLFVHGVNTTEPRRSCEHGLGGAQCQKCQKPLARGSRRTFWHFWHFGTPAPRVENRRGQNKLCLHNRRVPVASGSPGGEGTIAGPLQQRIFFSPEPTHLPIAARPLRLSTFGGSSSEESVPPATRPCIIVRCRQPAT